MNPSMDPFAGLQLRAPTLTAPTGIPSPVPEPAMPTVKVYHFESYDFDKDQVVRSRRPATDEFIRRFHFHRIEEDAREVDTAEVDSYGLLAGDS